MGKRLLLDIAPTGVRHYADVDEDGFTAIEHTPTVVEQEIVDECSKLRGLYQKKQGTFQLAAKIPINTYYGWKKEWRQKHADTWTWQTFLAMKLNSRDNEKLRVGHTDSGIGMKL